VAIDTAHRRQEAPRALRVAAAWSWRVLVILLLGWVAVLVLARIQVVVIPAVLALLLATFMHPPVRALAAAGVPRGLAALGVVITGVGLLSAGVWAVYAQVRGEAGSLADDIEAGVDDIEEWLVEGPLGVDPDRIDRAVDRGRAVLQEAASGERAIGGAMAALEVLAGAGLTVVLLFFFLKDGARMWEWLARRAGADARPHVLEAGARAWWALGGYMRGQAIIAAVDAFFIGIGILVLGVPFAVPLIALTFIASFFPIVGATVAGAAAVLVALADGGVVTALMMLAVVVGVQQTEGNVLEPVVMSRTAHLHPVVVVMALGAGGALAGLVGAFLAVPVAAAATAVGSYVWGRVGPEDQRAPITGASGPTPPGDPG